MPRLSPRILHRALPAALVLLLAWCAPPVAAQVTDEVSDITGVRRVASDEIQDIQINTYKGNDAGVRASCELDSEAGEEQWTVALYAFADATTSVSAAQQMQFEVDGALVQPLRVESRTRQMSGTTLEVKTAYFSRSIFAQIANAEMVTMQAGAASFELSPNAQNDMKKILEIIPPADARRTASNDGGR